MIPAEQLRMWLAARPPHSEILAALPRDGVVLSGDEVAQIRGTLHLFWRKQFCPTDETRAAMGSVLSLLDSAGEETG